MNELRTVKRRIIAMYQRQSYADKINALWNSKPIGKKSNLKSLFSFLDENGLLRVGRRLANLKFDYSKKFPLVIPYACHLTQLIVQEAHEETIHRSNSLTLAVIRHEY